MCIVMCTFPWVYFFTPEVFQWHWMKEFSRPVWKHTHSCRGWINPAGCSQMSSFRADARRYCRPSSFAGLLLSPRRGNDAGLCLLSFPMKGSELGQPATWTFDQVCVYRGGSVLGLRVGSVNLFISLSDGPPFLVRCHVKGPQPWQPYQVPIILSRWRPRCGGGWCFGHIIHRLWPLHIHVLVFSNLSAPHIA